MIGSGLKKLAAEHGMKVAQGVAYGSMRGYCATLSEGAGYKQMVLATRFPEQSKQDELMGIISRRNVAKDFRVQNLSFAPNGINIVFLDNPGTMKKIREFIDWFFPLLGSCGASYSNICPECGAPVTDGRWILRDGVAAFYVHDACAQRISLALEEAKEARKQPGNGSYFTGFLGAFLGALLGAVIWGLVLMAGFVASILGFVIGWLANLGYNLLKGKQGKGKVVILILAVIFGVLLGTLLPDIADLVRGISAGEYPMAYGDIPAMILALLLYEPEYRIYLLSNGAMGLLFAAIGVFALLRRTSAEVAEGKLVILE